MFSNKKLTNSMWINNLICCSTNIYLYHMIKIFGYQVWFGKCSGQYNCVKYPGLIPGRDTNSYADIYTFSSRPLNFPLKTSWNHLITKCFHSL